MQKNNTGAFVTLISVFFFWGFVAASNDILIPVFKKALNLSQLQSQLISFAFYIAYTVGSLAYFIISSIRKEDILHSIGYRNGLALGLCISAAGTLLFIPAANSASFVLLISGLFIVGLGFSLQQIAANPLAVNLGNPKEGNMRLSLAGGINNIGTTIGPVIVAFAIFGKVSSGQTTLNLEAVQTPYLVLGAAFLLVAAIFKFSNIPDKAGVEEEKSGASIMDIISMPQVLLGMIAIFVYVGVEVSTASNLPEFMKQKLGTQEHDIAPFVSLFWAFSIFALVNFIAGYDISQFYPYLFIVILLATADTISDGNPARQLFIYSLLGMAALITGIFAHGIISVFAFISVGLFCSTLWPCIFTLSIAGLGNKTNTASSLLIMMIMGGGVISLVQGALANDSLLGIQHSYWVGVVCFAYLAFFALKIQGELRSRGVEFGKVEASGH
jgi:FHS family L-fucose permease-like MFS transporter